MNKEEPKIEKPKEEFDSKLLDLSRVTRVTGGGKKLRFRAVIAIGNKEGKVGIGVAKGKDVAQAIKKAQRLAKKNLIEIPLLNGTIPYQIEAKYGPSRVILKPQKRESGIIVGGPVRIICKLGGIKKISAKILSKSRNKLNNAMATIMALKKIKYAAK